MGTCDIQHRCGKYVTGAILCLMLFVIHSSPAYSKVRIDLHWTKIEAEISPKSENHVSRSASSYILDGNTIQTSKGIASARLGGSADGQNDYGNGYSVKYKIANGAIYVSRTFSGLVESEVITTDGASSCSASVSYRPKSGSANMTEYRISNHDFMTLASLSAEGVECTIQQTE